MIWLLLEDLKIEHSLENSGQTYGTGGSTTSQLLKKDFRFQILLDFTVLDPPKKQTLTVDG